MPSRAALAKIHIAKKELKISEDNYRLTLSGFGVESAKDLSDNQANELVLLFRKVGWTPKVSPQSSVRSQQSGKYFRIELPVNRGDEYATQKQMNMLCGLWVSYSREKTAESFRKFVCSIAKIDMPDWLLKADVQKVMKGIKSLRNKKTGESNESCN